MRLPPATLVATLGVILVAALVACRPTAFTPGGNGAASAAGDADVSLAARTVWAGTYNHDIQPIFDQYCISCHGPTRAENGLRLDSYDNTMRGTQHGPVVVPGSPGTSTLAAVIQGAADPKIRMPHEARKLTPNRIQNILLWIEAGAPK